MIEEEKERMLSRKILITFEFDGTGYAGWQLQPTQRTVQGVLEEALREVLQDPDLRVTGSGRTDAGVHALGMCATFTTLLPIPLEGLVRGVNNKLPEDLQILQAREVPTAFCARRWSKGKLYRYRIWNHLRPSALERDRAWHIFDPLDIKQMREGAKHLLGRHDFSAFRASGCSSTHPIRELYDIRIFQEGSMVTIEVSGSAFLRHMVRNLVGVLVPVGKGLRPPEWVREVIQSGQRGKGGPTAPPQGLYLVEVYYNFPPTEQYPTSL